MPDTSEVIFDRIMRSLDRLSREGFPGSVSPSDFKDPKTMEAIIRILFFLEKRSTSYFSMACAMICACFDSMICRQRKRPPILH